MSGYLTGLQSRGQQRSQSEFSFNVIANFNTYHVMSLFTKEGMGNSDWSVLKSFEASGGGGDGRRIQR